MVQRLALAIALLGQPDLLVLDEPTSNLDPVGRRNLCDIVSACRQRGAAVLLASHVLSEIEETCTRVVILREGRVVVAGPIDELRGDGGHQRTLKEAFAALGEKVGILVSQAMLVMRDTLASSRQDAHRSDGQRRPGHNRTSGTARVVAEERMFDTVMEQAERQQLANGREADRSGRARGSRERAHLDMFQSFVFAIAGVGGQVIALLNIRDAGRGTPQRKGAADLVRPAPDPGQLPSAGRAAAGVVLLAAFWVLMSCAFLWFFASGSALPATVRYAPLLLFLKCTMLGMIALALSLYVRPLVAAILAFVVSSDWVSSQGWLYIILPGDDRLGIGREILGGRLLELRDVALAAGYALAISVATLWSGFFASGKWKSIAGGASRKRGGAWSRFGQGRASPALRFTRERTGCCSRSRCRGCRDRPRSFPGGEFHG